MTGPVPGDQAEGILPRDWAVLAPLVDTVLDAAPEQRAVLIQELAAGDPERRRALEHLVAECERDLPLLNRVAAERFDALAREPDVSLLPELLAERYRTGRELGRGGMARVYLARDTKHGRDVAIKVIRAELSASLGHGRFLREIEIAARLRHPNIVPLYDSGEVGGSLYFVMPFEEGPSLRERLRQDGALPIADAMSVLRDVARALAYAHDHGVVHRDVKPDNVMLSGDAAVVTDFGIAKAVSAALTDGGAGPTLTQAGSGIGTPAYMAPEQAMGDPGTDHRADIYSFGCLAYEVFTGTPPFPEPTSHQVIAAHVSRVPRSVTELRTEVPPDVAQLIAHCLAKLPDERPQRVRDVLGVLDGTTTRSGIRPSPIARRSVRGTAVRWGAVALALSLLAFAGYRVTRAPLTADAPIKLAILPFANFAGDTAAAFLTDGLPDEIATVLGRVPGIQIQGRSGARAYSGQLSPDVTEAGRKLGADFVVTGTLRREEGNWIVSMDLERAADQASQWGNTFTIGPNQQAGAVVTIVSSLLAGLRSQFPNTIGADPVLASARNPMANEHYLRGRFLLSRRRQSVSAAAEAFRLAIREDTLFAPAWSGLSMAQVLAPFFQDVPSGVVIDSVVGAARRALDLDPGLAQPHVALALTHWFAYRWDSAEVELETAIARDVNDVEARIQYARHLQYTGRHREAMEQLQAARVVEPTSAVLFSYVAYQHYLNGQLDSATTAIRLALENDSTNYTTLATGALIYIRANRPAEARRLIDRLSLAQGIKGYLLARTGDSVGARRQVDLVVSQANTVRALTSLGLGDTASALDALEAATKAREIWHVLRTMSDPVFDPIRGSKRFAALLQSVGLPASAGERPGRN